MVFVFAFKIHQAGQFEHSCGPVRPAAHIFDIPVLNSEINECLQDDPWLWVHFHLYVLNCLFSLYTGELSIIIPRPHHLPVPGKK